MKFLYYEGAQDVHTVRPGQNTTHCRIPVDAPSKPMQKLEIVDGKLVETELPVRKKIVIEEQPEGTTICGKCRASWPANRKNRKRR